MTFSRLTEGFQIQIFTHLSQVWFKMMGDTPFGVYLVFVVLFCNLGTVVTFKDGAPFDMCKFKGNAFHTVQYNTDYVRWIQPMEDFNIPSPYQLVAEKHTYREYVLRNVDGKIIETPDMIKVTLSVLPGQPMNHFKGFYIKAIPTGRLEDDPRAYGTFAVVDEYGHFAVKNKDAETVLCYVLHWYSDTFPIGGVSHLNDTEKKELTVYWFPPKKCNIGKVTFEATVVYNYSIYWSNVQSQTILPEGFGNHNTYPACQYYADPIGYYKKVEEIQKNKGKGTRKGNNNKRKQRKPKGKGENNKRKQIKTRGKGRNNKRKQIKPKEKQKSNIRKQTANTNLNKPLV